MLELTDGGRLSIAFSIQAFHADRSAGGEVTCVRPDLGHLNGFDGIGLL